MSKCLKCGREAEENNVFCPACLADMANYPVKPGTPVVLPTRPARTPEHRPSPRATPPEAVIARLRRQRRSLWIAVAALSAALCLCAAFLLVQWLVPEEFPSVPIGQNYITSTGSSEGNVSRETSAPVSESGG